MEKFKKYSLLMIIPVLGIIISIFYYNNSKSIEEVIETELLEPIIIETKVDEVIEKIPEQPIIKKIKVDIKGAVKKTGVYETNENSRVIDVINMAGGFNNSADTSTINLSKILNDEDVVIVYTKEELEKIRQDDIVVQYIEKECVCPKLEENKACINDTATSIDEEETTKLININTATLEELDSLPGIGEAKAKDIIEYRNKTKFNTIEEIKNIKGIGESVYDKFKELIEV